LAALLRRLSLPNSIGLLAYDPRQVMSVNRPASLVRYAVVEHGSSAAGSSGPYIGVWLQ